VLDVTSTALIATVRMPKIMYTHMRTHTRTHTRTQTHTHTHAHAHARIACRTLLEVRRLGPLCISLHGSSAALLVPPSTIHAWDTPTSPSPISCSHTQQQITLPLLQQQLFHPSAFLCIPCAPHSPNLLPSHLLTAPSHAAAPHLQCFTQGAGTPRTHQEATPPLVLPSMQEAGLSCDGWMA